MQALYAYLAGGSTDLKSGEAELMRNINKFYELYLILLSLMQDLIHYAGHRLEEGKQKHLATAQDLNPNTWFLENFVAQTFTENKELNRLKKEWKVITVNEKDLLHKIYLNVKNSEEYKTFVDARKNEQAISFYSFVFKEFVANESAVSSYLEELNIYFLGDLDFVSFLVLKTLKGWNPETPPQDQILLPMFKDKIDDVAFVQNLFRKAVLNRQEYETLIASFTPNWEADRLAGMDVLLMVMALTEILHFPNIPVKVSMNEYIDISKEYSSTNSKLFINGVLDKVVEDLKQKGKINKSGRGLVE